MITTKLQEKPDEIEADGQDIGDNEGFEKLPGDGNKIGQFIVMVRESMVSLINNQKVDIPWIDPDCPFLLLWIDACRLWIETSLLGRFHHLFRLRNEQNVRHTGVSHRGKSVHKEFR